MVGHIIFITQFLSSITSKIPTTRIKSKTKKLLGHARICTRSILPYSVYIILCYYPLDLIALQLDKLRIRQQKMVALKDSKQPYSIQLLATYTQLAQALWHLMANWQSLSLCTKLYLIPTILSCLIKDLIQLYLCPRTTLKSKSVQSTPSRKSFLTSIDAQYDFITCTCTEYTLIATVNG